MYYYKGVSFRTKGGFGSTIEQHKVFATELDGVWFGQLPYGSTIGSFDNSTEAIRAACAHIERNGWTTCKTQAENYGKHEAWARSQVKGKARKNGTLIAAREAGLI